ncbi:MAG: hypothetical protein DI547_05025 [Sphingobium sp.]|nr:MAG: hypothetical protein DI547_05025 [Sphingobium sp.]
MSNLQILLRDGEHVVWEKAISRDSITLKGGRAYLPATVLGKFTTGTDAGKHTILTPGATDGSQTPDAVLRSGVDATLSDRPGVAHVRDCRMNPAMLVWPSGASDELKAASLATLKGKGVLMNTPPVQRAAAIAADFAAGNYAADGNALALGDIVSTARAGTAYALDAAGVFQAFTTGQPRRTSRGLLAEPEKTNLLRYSTDMTNAAWSVVTATKTTLAGAVGPFNRVSIAASSAATPGSNIGANTLVDLVAGTAYAVTYWYEIGSSGSVLFRIQQNFGSGLPSNAAGKISENGIGATSGGAGPITEVITRNLGGVYWRTTLIFMPNATGPHTIRIGPAALTVGPDIVGLGAQVEEAFPSSIIPTTTATVTRPADNLVPLGALAKALGAEQATINIDILDMANATGDILASGPTKARRMASIDSSGDMYLRINADRAHVQRGKPVNPRLTRLSLLRNAEGTRLTRDGGVTALDGPSVAINDGVSLMPSIPGYIVSLQTSPDADAILPTTRASGWKTLKGAGGAGGFITNVWRSSNGTMLIRADVHNAYRRRVGETAWTELITAKTMPTVQLLKNGGASEIVSAPSNPLRLYMLKTAVAESGTPTYLYRSDDEGDHWTLVSAYVAVTDMNSNRSDRTGGYYIAVDPANPDVLLVSSPAGVRMSTDAGATWSAIAALGTANTTGFGIAFDPTSSVVSGKTQGIYVMKGGTGVYRSTDGGANFTLTTSGPTTFRNMVCAQDGTLWLAPNDATASVIWRFKAGAWASKNTHAAANRTIVGVAVNPADANHVVALNFSGYISESKDGGETWGGMATYTFRAAPNIPWHLWTNAPLLAASNIVFGQDGYVHVAEGLGMYRTKPGEPNASITVWEEESVGIEELVANDILVLPDGTVLTEGWDRPIFRSRDMDSYARRHGPDNTNTIVHCWSADYYGGDFVVALCNTTSPSAVERSSYSTDGGRTWTKFAAVPAAVTSNAKVGGCIAAATDQKLYWACAEGGPLYYSPDRGATWSVVTGSGINTNVASDSGWGPSKNYKRRILVADKLSPGVVYAYNCGGASTAGFYRIVDGVATRVFTGEIAGASQYNAKCKQKPGASSLFFTSGPGGASTFAGPSFGTGTAPFRRSEDGGVTWTTVPDIEEVWDFSWGKAKAGSQYPTMFALGFYKGVWGHWMSTDDARTFTSIGGTGAAALPDYSMDAEVCIAGDPNIFGRLYAGFQGSGFKYFDLPTGGGGG